MSMTSPQAATSRKTAAKKSAAKGKAKTGAAPGVKGPNRRTQKKGGD